MLELNKNELNEVNGGLLAGAIAGGIFGFTGGLLVTTIYGCATGTISGNSLWKGAVVGTLSGAAIGAYTPV